MHYGSRFSFVGKAGADSVSKVQGEVLADSGLNSTTGGLTIASLSVSRCFCCLLKPPRAAQALGWRLTLPAALDLTANSEG